MKEIEDLSNEELVKEFGRIWCEIASTFEEPDQAVFDYKDEIKNEIIRRLRI